MHIFREKNHLQRNLVFTTNSDFLMLISFQPIFLNLRYFKLWILSDQMSFKYQRFIQSGCKDFMIKERKQTFLRLLSGNHRIEYSS